VTVTSSNATKFEINPNTGEPFGVATGTAPRAATNTIYFDKRHSLGDDSAGPQACA